MSCMQVHGSLASFSAIASALFLLSASSGCTSTNSADSVPSKEDASTEADASSNVTDTGVDAATKPSAPTVSATLDGVALTFKKTEVALDGTDMRMSATNGVDGETPFNWESLDVTFPGAPGTYDCASRQNSVSYHTPDEGRDYTAQGGPLTSCSIEVIEVGPVGSPVRVKFSAKLVHNNNEGSSDGTKHSVEGSFQLVRSPDKA